MKIHKLKKYEDGLTEAEEDKLLTKEGMRRLTPDEFLDDCQEKEYDDYLPCRVQTKKGLLARGYYGLLVCNYRRGVGAGRALSGRFGVLGVKKEKKKEA